MRWLLAVQQSDYCEYPGYRWSWRGCRCRWRGGFKVRPFLVATPAFVPRLPSHPLQRALAPTSGADGGDAENGKMGKWEDGDLVMPGLSSLLFGFGENGDFGKREVL